MTLRELIALYDELYIQELIEYRDKIALSGFGNKTPELDRMIEELSVDEEQCRLAPHEILGEDFILKRIKNGNR